MFSQKNLFPFSILFNKKGLTKKKKKQGFPEGRVLFYFFEFHLFGVFSH